VGYKKEAKKADKALETKITKPKLSREEILDINKVRRDSQKKGEKESKIKKATRDLAKK
jgi:hypothetical protein